MICFDIVGLMPINDISREVGDLAIMESLKRIEQVCTENMLQFRIGGALQSAGWKLALQRVF